MPAADPTPLTLFVSYSYGDEALKDELVLHLANLKRQGKIRAWQDRDIEAGAEWNAEIKQQLESAEVILLLITARFINSDYCYDLEMQHALQRHAAGTARVIPIILKPCDWQGSPFSKLQVLPKDAKPVTTWANQDEAFLNIVQGIRQAVDTLQPTAPLSSPPPSSPPSSPSSPSSPSPSSPPSPSSHPPSPSLPPQFSTYNPATFAGRIAETAELTAQLQGNCRIVAIVGMTGIGKTALGERVIANLLDAPHPQSLSQGEMDLNPALLLPREKGLGDEGSSLPYYRFSLDDRSLTPDFASSGAALLRTLGEEPTLEDQKDPNHLLTHLLNRLNSHPCRMQIDSLERLLRGNDQEGWSEFCDPLWLDLLQQFLSQTHCPSQLLLTSQDIPGDLDAVASRYPQFWHCQPLQGLSTAEQQDLFQKLGLLANAATADGDADYLRRIGDFYAGHPLVLQVIADEIRQPPFSGNIAHYWHHYAADFATTATPTNKLARSRLFRRRVRQRVEQTLQRLPAPARQMLCACAVFRRPVPVEFWLAMLPIRDPEATFATLQDRHLVEYASPPSPLPSLSPQTHTHTHLPIHPPPLLVRQHNLTRSVAYDLLKADNDIWQAAERRAAHLWLNDYEPAPDMPNLETVRGYLEAFDHYCEVGDWEDASEIYIHQLPATNQALHWQLLIWSQYKELIEVSRKLVDRISSQTKRLCLNQIGNSNSNLGNVEKAIEYYQQALQFTLETGDHNGEGNALGNLGIAYSSLGQYERAIDFLQQYLTIAREIGDRNGEGAALGNLGIAYKSLGQYERAIDFHQQYLTIAREIGDRQGEGNALGNLGNAYYSLGQYERAIDFHQQYLTIAREIGDRQGEGAALANIGETQLKLEQHADSLTNNQLALEIFQEIGDRSAEAEVLKNLAELHQALGEVETTRQYCQQALTLATELGIPLKAECETLMAALEQGEN